MTDERLAQLIAMAPAKRRKPKRFVKVDVAEVARAFRAMGCQKAIVWLWLLDRAWFRNSRTVAVPNAELTALGVERRAKTRALQRLAAAGLIRVEWRARKSPIATLL
jgi:DNA-binding transcriptional ArsR family regulator